MYIDRSMRNALGLHCDVVITFVFIFQVEQKMKTMFGMAKVPRRKRHGKSIPKFVGRNNLSPAVPLEHWPGLLSCPGAIFTQKLYRQ